MSENDFFSISFSVTSRFDLQIPDTRIPDHSMIRTSLLGLCTNTAINSHFTTLLLLTRHGSIGLYF